MEAIARGQTNSHSGTLSLEENKMTGVQSNAYLENYLINNRIQKKSEVFISVMFKKIYYFPFSINKIDKFATFPISKAVYQLVNMYITHKLTGFLSITCFRILKIIRPVRHSKYGLEPIPSF